MVHVYVGTRPEVIKLCPVVLALRERDVGVRVVTTGQHSNLAEYFKAFGVKPDICFGPQLDGPLDVRTARMMFHIGEDIREHKSSCSVVQGDTATVFATAAVSFMNNVPVVHVEAGLRTYDLNSPFPEEGFRQMVSRISAVNYVPTQMAWENLEDEGISIDSMELVGNTAIDALHLVEPSWPVSVPIPNGDDGFVLVTCHRRENLGENAERLALYVRSLAQMGVAGVVLLHPNFESAKPFLQNASPKFISVPQVSYPEMLALLSRANAVITDSGGLTEECTHLGVPVIIYRNTTERQEAVSVGAARRAHTISDVDSYVKIALRGMWSPIFGAQDVFGNGKSAHAIALSMIMRGLT